MEKLKMKEITEIEKYYPNWYSAESELSYDDQKFIWESIPLDIDTLHNNNVNVYVNGIGSGTYKQQEKDSKELTKLYAIDKLNSSDWKTPAKEIAVYLESIFGYWVEKPDHWLSIAQHFTPKAIRAVYRQMLKSSERSDITIKSYGAYFTSIIKYKPKRHRTLKKESGNTNGTRKLNEKGLENV